MKIRLKLFASAREIVGSRDLVIELPEDATTTSLLGELVMQYPGLRALASTLKVAVNREYVERECHLTEEDEVALIPPVSGGLDLFEITESPLSLDAIARAVGQRSSGAIASFLGVVREYARGRQVDHLEYDAYPEMAVAKMREIGDEIRARWPVGRITMVHRIGRLNVGEASVAIAIASPHRREALEACAYAIERLKEIVPVWKKEVWADGSEWIGSTVDEYREQRGAPNVDPIGDSSTDNR